MSITSTLRDIAYQYSKINKPTTRNSANWLNVCVELQRLELRLHQCHRQLLQEYHEALRNDGYYSGTMSEAGAYAMEQQIRKEQA